MLFSWLRNRRRKKVLSEEFPAEWVDFLEQNVPHYQTLTEDEQAKLRDDLRIFQAEKEWEGCGGLELTDEIKVTISAFACLLVLGMTDEYFERVQSILVYPRAYTVPDQPSEDGLLVEDSQREGEAHYRGPVVLNWEEIQADARQPEDGHNLVFHEFAHQLDMMNGEADGVPWLPDQESYQRWQKVVGGEYRRLIRVVEHGEPTFLDDYGAEHESEFFAVTTECFFTQPRQLQQRHPRLYEVFAGYFNQDPASRPSVWPD
jgi:Mlc titration factor MtfA (ptsG expression regulator)